MATELKTFRFDEDVLQAFRDISKRRGDLSYHVNEAMRVYPLIQKKVKPYVEPQRPKYEAKDLEFAEWMLTLITNNQPAFKVPNLESWAKDIRLMRERDNRTHYEMGVVWKWAHSNSFWQSNILSASKFRQKYDQLSMQMRNKGSPNGQSLSQRSASATERALAQIENAGDILGSNDTSLRLQVDQ